MGLSLSWNDSSFGGVRELKRRMRVKCHAWPKRKPRIINGNKGGEVLVWWVVANFILVYSSWGITHLRR